MRRITVGGRAFKAAYNQLLNRLHLGKTDADSVAKKILEEVRKEGDSAVLRYTKKFDRLTLTSKTMRVSKAEITRAYQNADEGIISSLRYARDRIFAFHKKQKSKDWAIRKAGIYLGERVHPLDAVGIYVPGGTASYPSSVLMNAIPAQIAGCKQIRICTPTPDGRLSPYLLIAADLVNITEIYRIGGVQAIGALAFGTKTIPKVDKIVGPGNQYVAAAKRLVYGTVDIDMIAGPSELLIIADQDANPAYLASDLLSQAEHDKEAVVILLTPSPTLWKRVALEMKKQQASLARKEIISASLSRHGVVFITKDIEQAISMANAIAPEHLSLFVKEPFRFLDRIIHAGSVFLGEETPQSLGDYIAGPNHVLPTGGTARFFSPLSVDDFIKKSHVISYSRKALQKCGDHLIRIAEVEGLTAHANMVRVRR